MTELLTLSRRPTRHFGANDLTAIGPALHPEAHLSVPENFSVIGFDDIELATTLSAHDERCVSRVLSSLASSSKRRSTSLQFAHSRPAIHHQASLVFRIDRRNAASSRSTHRK